MKDINKKRSVSVVIPTHDPGEIYGSFLLDLIQSIAQQTLLPLEIIMGGNSRPNYIDSILEKYNGLFSVKFFLNKSTSTSTNLNDLIPNSSGKIVKLMFMDDFFIQKDSLQIIEDILTKGKTTWLATGSWNFDSEKSKYTRRIIPYFSRRIIDGKNTIGCPSVIAFKRDYYLPFDPALTMFLDCDWYLTMCHFYGKPVLIRDAQIASRIHKGQQTHSAMANWKKESIYVIDKHKRTIREKLSNKCSCQKSALFLQY
jgi:glycosyltransferase involved in cell wall biosynthesis